MATPTTTSTVFFLLFLQLAATAYSIGVNYGTLGDNLPPPATVANFIKTRTTIDRVKIFDLNPEIIKAFANTGIFVTVTAPNGDIVNLADVNFARQWVQNHIKPFYPQTKFNYILVGSEVLHWGDKTMLKKLVPAMRSLYSTLQAEGMGDIKVTTSHSLGMMRSSLPPSNGRFRPGFAKHQLTPMLKFLNETRAPFMVNPYPYFGLNPKSLDFYLFKPNRGLYDRFTKLHYTNQFDALLDAVYSAMKTVGYADVDIVIGETGWPSVCEGWNACSPDNAAAYNGQLLKHLEAGKGTPLMPNRRFETYIFALFNENQKPGPIAEKNWGLFQPDFTPVYNSGILRNGQQKVPAATNLWCVPKPDANIKALISNINYVCGQGIDCGPIQPGGPCYKLNDTWTMATYAMNAYYQAEGHAGTSCDFASTGIVTTVNPSHDSCKM